LWFVDVPRFLSFKLDSLSVDHTVWTRKNLTEEGITNLLWDNFGRALVGLCSVFWVVEPEYAAVRKLQKEES
jgi:hypothetical protein